MNIPSEARAISQTIIEWCFRDEQGSDDENLPTHLVENLLIRQKKECTDKACDWLFKNFYHEETMVDCIAYKHEDEDVNVMIEHFKQAMEE